MIQFRVLNRSRGSAAQAPRAQPNGTLFQDTVSNLQRRSPAVWYWTDRRVRTGLPLPR